MLSISTTLDNVIGQYPATLKCAAAIQASGAVSDRVGDFAEFTRQGLASAILGPSGDPVAAFQMAAQYENDRRMLPQSMGQGDLFALLDKPSTEFVVVLFGVKVGDFHEHLRHCKEISSTLLELFASSET